LGYDQKVLGLPNDMVSTVETMIGCGPLIGILETTCMFYNSLSELVKAY